MSYSDGRSAHGASFEDVYIYLFFQNYRQFSQLTMSLIFVSYCMNNYDMIKYV